MELEIKKEWEEFLEKYKEYFKTEQKDMSKPTIQPKKEQSNKTTTNKPPPKSVLSELHKKYKTMTSNNLHKHFDENPKDWEDYHKISQTNEKSFPEEEIPRNLMIKYLENIPGKKQKIVADLGCGFAEINEYFKENDRFVFYNFDHVSTKPIITKRDIKIQN